jgi:foldase protein PrsA
MRLIRFLPLPVLLVVVLLAAGCGGGGGTKVPADDVALVGKTPITKAQLAGLMAGAKRNYKARKQPFPKVGTSGYDDLQNRAVAYLVEEAELQQKAATLGITVKPKDVDTRLKELKQQYFQGNQKEYEKQLKAQGLTEPQLRQDLFAQILSEKIYTKVTSKVKVTNADVQTYYNEHKSSYTTQASRDVRHILVSNKKLADQLEQQLKGGASFATLAKKYSKDTSSARNGGKLTINKGQTVPPFDKVAFALATGATSPPVHTQYGWHIIQALSAVRPEKQTPLSSVKDQIQQQLLTTKKQTAMSKWVDNVKKEYAKQITYQVGYQPPATSTATTTSNSTTG